MADLEGGRQMADLSAEGNKKAEGNFLYIYDCYGPWSQQGLGGSMVKKNHTPVGQPLNATSNFDMLFEYEKYI